MSKQKFKLIAFDLDGVLTKEYLWQRLNRVAGISRNEDLKLLHAYQNYQISHETWIQTLSRKYQRCGKTRDDFNKIFNKVIFLPNAQQVVRKLQKKYSVCIVSSTFDKYVENVAKILNISRFFATYSFVFNRQNKVSCIKFKAPEGKDKVLFIKTLCHERKIEYQEVVFVGDSVNDLEAFKLTQHGILIGKGNSELIKASWKQVKSLKDILLLLLGNSFLG